MISLQQRAQQILQLIDLTSLNNTDNDFIIYNLCNEAITQFGNVAAVCIYSRFIPIAKPIMAQNNIKIATVTNFPHGSTDIEIALYETKLAIDRGADEVDIVFPYYALMQGNKETGAKMVASAKQICGTKILKVIIESGELKDSKLIQLASEVSIDNGADFIKTSTGKVAINATLHAAEIMLNTIKKSGQPCGFKAAGGIRTVSDAMKYLELTEQIMDSSWITAKNFRFGASSLLNDALAILAYKPQQETSNGY